MALPEERCCGGRPRLAGVKSVSNRIVVATAVPAQDVRAKVEEALLRRADLDPGRIGERSHDGTVELRGNVRSWSEKEEAASIAWEAPGVTNVENHIALVP